MDLISLLLSLPHRFRFCFLLYSFFCVFCIFCLFFLSGFSFLFLMWQSDRFVRNMKLWGPVMSLKSLQPYANPRSNYPGNGFWWNCLFLCLHFCFFYLQWCGFLNWYFSMMSFFWLVASCCGIWKCDMDLINVLYRSVFKWTVD